MLYQYFLHFQLITFSIDLLRECPLTAYSRSLCSGGVLFELTVVDSEVWPEITAVSQWRYATGTQN